MGTLSKRGSKKRDAAEGAGSAKAVAAPEGGEQGAVEAPTREGADPKVFALLTALIGGPYALYLVYLYLHLQSGLLRPVVADAGIRQVLIVGSQSSGTSQLAAGLQELGLEVEHEHSDARWAFCRDGTVSWFHGIRFLPDAPQEESLSLICSRWWDNIGAS